jgi:hypothetical protein
MEWNKFDVAAKLFSRAITLAKENDYRLGQLDASLGLLHVEIMKQGEVAKLSMALQVVDQGNGFEWNNDLLFFQTMLEIQPAIDTAELMARSLISKNRECAEEIYRLLDLIFAEVDVAHVAIQERSDQKPEILVASLTIIKDGLAQIIRLYSSQKAGENADQS